MEKLQEVKSINATVFIGLDSGLIVLRSEIVAFGPGYNSKGNDTHYLYLKTIKIEIDKNSYESLLLYFKYNITIISE